MLCNEIEVSVVSYLPVIASSFELDVPIFDIDDCDYDRVKVRRLCKSIENVDGAVRLFGLHSFGKSTSHLQLLAMRGDCPVRLAFSGKGQRGMEYCGSASLVAMICRG